MNYRFTYGHLIGRRILLNYFGEDTVFLSQSLPCCDVCESSSDVTDRGEETRVVLQTVKDLSVTEGKIYELYS